MSYVETVEHTVETHNGKEYDVTITRRRGLHTYTTRYGKEVLVDSVTIVDSGKLGVSHIYSPHKEYTEEERKAGRKAILEKAAKILAEQGYW